MTKANAKLLLAELVERGFAPKIREASGDYVITVPTPNGVTPAQINQVVNAISGIVGKAKLVEFT